jgi:uncharacterized SAM-binding protein YcdF (DUF218 family)
MRLLIGALLTMIVIVVLVMGAARFLVVDKPLPSDVIVVLNGDRSDVRYSRGLELLKSNYGKTLLVDESNDFTLYGRTPVDLEQEFLQRSSAPAGVTVCPMRGDSTRDETRFVARCLEPLGAKSVLIVTSDYHTRRAYAIFRSLLPKYQWSVTSAHDPKVFGAHWWGNREWAKYTVTEWSKLLWWELVDRWRT